MKACIVQRAYHASPYFRTRPTDWLKLKPNKTAKLLIVGYLRNRTGLTSLLVGHWHQRDLSMPAVCPVD